MATLPVVAPPAQRRAPALPTAEQVVRLQAVRGYPSVSVLMSTTPGSVLTGPEAVRLNRLLAQATRRLRAEGPSEEAAAALVSLERLVDAAVGAPTSAALALYAGAGTATALRLPVPVRDRVVVDPSFATRDLVRALHRTPRHVVLVLSSREARLFEGAGDQLRPALSSTFPVREERRRGPDTARGRREEQDTAAFLRTVDRALRTYLRLHPAPLVLAGSPRVLAAFTGLSDNLSRLAGTIPVNLSTEPLSVLAERTRPVLEQYLLSRQQEALTLLERRTGARRTASGMVDAWLAARTERPEMLVVEQGLFYPARVSGDGDLLVPADDVEHPEVVDDAVDELIELVLDRGGWVAMVDDGLLEAHDGVALTLRSGG
jgi:hypothetical protein